MDIADVREALVEWAQEVCPTIQTAYTYPVSSKAAGDLPDVMAEVLAVSVALRSPDISKLELEQVRVKRFDCRLSFMFEPEPAETAVQGLDGFADALLSALLEDSTLGGRVDETGDEPSVVFDPPFAEYPDGTKGREAVLNLTVGHKV